LDHAKSIKTLK